MKKLVIISGVTGAIGSALLAEYGQQEDAIVYGISRQALPIEDFIQSGGTLPHAHLICSIQNFEPEGWNSFVNRIDFTGIEQVIYIHALGYFPFEIDQGGNQKIENDNDRDGINDRVTQLTYDVFVNTSRSLINSPAKQLFCIIFGGLSDAHHPTAHTSWWKTMERTKRFMRQTASERTAMIVCTISSVLCPHELVMRPYVFSQTDAAAKYWLSPCELAQFIANTIPTLDGGYHEIEKFKADPNFDLEHYVDEKFTPRKIAELYRRL